MRPMRLLACLLNNTERLQQLTQHGVLLANAVPALCCILGHVHHGNEGPPGEPGVEGPELVSASGDAPALQLEALHVLSLILPLPLASVWTLAHAKCPCYLSRQGIPCTSEALAPCKASGHNLRSWRHGTET